MKKLLSATALSCLLAVSVMAGDIPSVPGPPPQCTQNCLMAEPEPELLTLQERIILDSITEFLGILL